jgi:hypothetical protein
MANENNWVKILINKLGLPSTADFCRKTDLGRGLVDKLSAGDNQPRFDTLVKIKEAFPEVNMNWLITGRGEILNEVPDDVEVVILDLYRKHIKVRNDFRLTISLLSKIYWVAQEHDEWEEMNINSEAVGLEDGELTEFRTMLLLEQHQRRLISDVLRGTPEKPRGLLELETKNEKMKKLLDQVNGSIRRTINLLEQKG